MSKRVFRTDPPAEAVMQPPPTPMPSEGPYQPEYIESQNLWYVSVHGEGLEFIGLLDKEQKQIQTVSDMLNLADRQAHSRTLAYHSDAVRELVRAANGVLDGYARWTGGSVKPILDALPALRSALSNPALASYK